MALDISKLARMHDFYIEIGILGKIKCGSISLNSMSELGKTLKHPTVDGLQFTRQLIGLVCSKVIVNETQKEEEITEIAITVEEVGQLSDEELEFFAAEFISHNRWLLQPDADGEIKKNKLGVETISTLPTISDIRTPKDESSSNYLMRVFKEHIEKRNKQLERMINPHHDYLKTIKKIMNPFGGLQKSMFENSTLDALRRNFDLSDHLRDTISQFNKSTLDYGIYKETHEPIHARLPHPEFLENPTYETNRRLNNVIERLEGMQELAAQSAEIIRNMNDTALRMQSDYIRNADSSVMYTKLAIWIAAISLFVTSVFSCMSYYDSKNNIEQSKLLQDEIRSMVSTQKEGQIALVNAINDARLPSTQTQVKK